MFFSVIVPTHNRKETLAHCLQALCDQNHPNETIVVDDGSQDGTREMVAARFQHVQYIFQENRGPAAARNRGIRQARGDIIAFTDDDCVPPRDWLAKLAAGYARHPEIAGAGGGIIAPNEMLEKNIFARYERYLGWDVFRARDQEILGGIECPTGGTANMSYRRTVLEQVNGFDENFPVAAGEDADLNMRVCQLGYLLLYVPVRVIHLQEYSWKRFRRQFYLRGIGRNYYEQKHGAGYPSRWKIALRIIRRLIDFPLDLIRMRERKLAFIKLADGLITCQGQWVGK